VQEDQSQRTGHRGALVARFSVTLATIGLLTAGTGPLAVHAGLPPVRGLAVFLIGLLLGFLGFLFGVAALPRINDITTDPDDPPSFAAAAREPANQDRDLSYPASFAAEQRRGYPDLRPIVLAQPPGEAFVRAQRAAGELGWKTTYSDPAAGVFEAQEVSPTFLFVDDIVVRVRPEGEGSRIDVRSKSRDGKGDLGVNAKRIRAFTQAVAEGK
jgi:uncharacterized protein (DUF1499 family)